MLTLKWSKQRLLCGVVSVLLASPAIAQQIDFGDDSGEFSMDGECDDPRFAGPGMWQGELSVSNNHRDATDCRSLFEDGQVWLAETGNQSGLYYDENTGRGGAMVADHFGDNTGEWPFDGECDDPRLTGPGIADTLYGENEGRDAADCRALHEAGEVWWDM